MSSEWPEVETVEELESSLNKNQKKKIVIKFEKIC